MQNFTDIDIFPFHSELNFRLLVEFWEARLKNGEGSLFPDEVLAKLAAAPELKEPIHDQDILEKHHDLIRFLLTAVAPFGNEETDLIAVSRPFQHDVLYSTAAFKRSIPIDRSGESVSVRLSGKELVMGKTVHACLHILKNFYEVDRNFSTPIFITIHQKESGLDKIYKVEIDKRFCEIIQQGDPQPIEPSVIKFLTEKLYDLDLWLQYIRPADFSFSGLIVMRLTEVTEEEMLSSIKYDLLRKDAVVAADSFDTIQQKLRSIFGMPHLTLGLAYLDPNNNLVVNSSDSSYWKSVAEGSILAGCYGSIYERAWMEQRHVTVEDLEKFPFKTKTEEELLKNNIRSILLAPLVEEGETIGLLELATSKEDALNPMCFTKVDNLLPMFTAAVKRAKLDMEMEVRALIQEECTALHPAVQWRFLEAGVRLMNKRRYEPNAALEEIVFSNVYPFFGLADVRNSSLERNKAVQEDLFENFHLAHDLLERLYEKTRFPIIEDLLFKTNANIENLPQRLAAGDEMILLDFLKNEIHPLLDHFAGEEQFSEGIASYKEQLDPIHGVIYTRRNDFEDSLNNINREITEVIEDAEEVAQKMFPHYFEKYKTDGIEYTIYLGASLVQGKKFDPFYLKNFRLWQLMLMCSIHHRIEKVKPALKNALEITQLVLVHDQPVNIRFRADEKQFDVDGAYDIRYEIIKKRIDKAHIKDSNERLTQPGKIAIVYSHAKVTREYYQYFNYLVEKGLIEEEIEELELEELPGVNGLRALRITICPPVEGEDKEIDVTRDLERILNV